MTVARQIPDAARIPQVAASDPEHSVFVSANAGSGKTHVLTEDRKSTRLNSSHT